MSPDEAGKKMFLMQQLGKRNMWMLQLSFWLEFALEATDLEVGHKETEVLERDSGSRAREGEGRVGKCELAAVPGKQLREQVRERGSSSPLLRCERRLTHRAECE